MLRGSSTVLIGWMLISKMVVAQTIVPGGNVSGIWEASGSPYLVQGEITVPGGETLTIDQNVEVIFQGHYKFIVRGHLEAVGTEDDSILFTAADTVSGWHGIRFIQAPDSSHLSFCIIQYGRASGYYPDNSGGGICCDHSNPVILHCAIRCNSAEQYGGGIFCKDLSSPTISHCLISENRMGEFCNGQGGGIHCGYATAPIIAQCNISGNWTDFNGGGGYCGYESQAIFSYCSIYGNRAGYEGGGISCAYSNTSFDHCLVYSNAADYHGGGIRSLASELTVTNCTISQNTASLLSGGIYCGYYSYPTLVNTIVEGNTGTGGVYFYNVNQSMIIYCDFYNNQEGDFIGGAFPAALGIINTVNANGDSCDAFFNIYLDPLFVDPGSRDFQLTANSPCIDAGNPASPPDPDSTVADIGAFYFPQLIPSIEDKKMQIIPAASCLLSNFPNPFNATTVLSFELRVTSFVNLGVYDLSGRKVVDLVNGWWEAGQHEVTFDGSGFASGVYVYWLKAGEFEASGKMVLMK